MVGNNFDKIFSAQRGIERADDESVNDMSQSDEIERGRNGNDLTKIIETLLPSFDKFSIWQYGCNCQFLMSGDRPMSHPGYGRPVDALDRICKVSFNVRNKVFAGDFVRCSPFDIDKIKIRNIETVLDVRKMFMVIHAYPNSQNIDGIIRKVDINY